MTNIVELNQPNLKDVPDSLRRLADAIENGTVDPAERAVIVTSAPEGEVSVYAYGDVGDVVVATGLLNFGIASLINTCEHDTP